MKKAALVLLACVASQLWADALLLHTASPAEAAHAEWPLLAVATGPFGVALAGLATLVGLVPIALRVRRVHLMAALLVPVLLTYAATGV